MSTRITFGEWLGDQIKACKQTQTSLADLIDVSPSAVSQWVNNVQRPHRRTLRKVASALDLNVNEALVRAGYPPDTPGYVLPEEHEPEPEATDRSPDIDPNLEAALLMEGIDPDDLELTLQVIRALVRDKTRDISE